MDKFSLPLSVGRGRGLSTVAMSPISVGRGLGTLAYTSTPMPGLRKVVEFDDTVNLCHLKPVSESASLHTEKGEVPIEFIADMAQQIGHSIGEAIASSLESRATCNVGVNASNSGGMDMSNLSLVLKSDIREPVYFRGDGSDKCTVAEWEKLMSVYMRKKGFSVNEQSEEVLSRLMGQAGQVVKVSLRSNPSTDLSQGPDPIFDILKHHFSDVAFSTMPLADFCATLPLTGEQPFDYWLRLNRAMEVAEECAKRQNERIDNPSRLLTAMFIRHCPDPELALVFKCKPVHQWTAADVHERLEECRKERKFSRPAKVLPPVVTTLRQEVSAAVSPTMPAVGPATQSPNPVSSPVQSPSPQGSTETMDRILTLLERVLVQRPHQSNRQPRGGNRNIVRVSGPCQVCSSTEHDTRSHCRDNRLCFLCFVSGHERWQCPKAGAQQPTDGVAAASAGQRQGN